MYRAAVKYAVDATSDEKVSALRDGIIMCALELVEEHSVDPEMVAQWCEEASDEAWRAAPEVKA